MISSEFYCPECGEIWDMSFCDHCCYEAPDGLHTPKSYKDEESYKRRVQEKSKVRRPRESRKEQEVE